MDVQLKNKGVPEHFIRNMTISMKKDIIKNTDKFLNGSVVILNESSKKEVTRKAIPSSQMNFYINTYQAQSPNNKKRCLVYVYYKWHGHGVPACRFTDTFGISWGKEWEHVPRTWYHVDEIRYKSSKPKFYKDNNIKQISRYGVSWSADLRTWAVPFGDFEESVGGFGRIVVQQTRAGISGNKIVIGKYAHKTAYPSNISFSFGPASISFNGSSYDQVATSAYLKD